MEDGTALKDSHSLASRSYKSVPKLSMLEVMAFRCNKCGKLMTINGIQSGQLCSGKWGRECGNKYFVIAKKFTIWEQFKLIYLYLRGNLITNIELPNG